MRTSLAIWLLLAAGSATGIVSPNARADVFTIDNLRVDVTAQDSVRAKSVAFANARLDGARKLIERLTTAEDRLAVGGVEMTSGIASRLAAAVDVGEEKRSGTRYFGILSVKFDQAAVATWLKELGLAFVTSSAARAILAPIAEPGPDSYAWRRAWTERESDNLLTPYVVSDTLFDATSQWEDISQLARQADANRGIVAGLAKIGEQYYVGITDLQPRTEPRRYNTLGPYDSIEQAADQALIFLENTWKRLTLVRESDLTSIRATAVYSSLEEWNAIRNSLRFSANISGLSIKSVMTRGADISFAFAGAPAQLSTELRARGVFLSASPDGWQMEVLGQ